MASEDQRRRRDSVDSRRRPNGHCSSCSLPAIASAQNSSRRPRLTVNVEVTGAARLSGAASALTGCLAHDGSRARNLQVCVPGTYIHRRRIVSPFFHLWLPQRCHTADRSGCRQIRFLPALRASLRTEGHRQFILSKDQYRVTHPPAPASHWRYRQTAAFHRDAESATTQRKFASCRRRD